MITYVNSSNADKYSILFSAATQSLIAAEVLEPALGTDGNPLLDDTGLIVAEDPITTVEQYFSYLPDLIKLGTSDNKYEQIRSLGRRYTMLPLDENVFVVDGNARTISVPPAFQSNGVAVQGDKYAEIVYFMVDRFYDITDLDTCDIYIQWTNANGESGVSTPWVVDIISEPNKMIIGWALSSDITKYAGTLRFALRFFQWDDQNLSTIKYSWSTLTQTVQIKTSLDFTFGNGQYMIEDVLNDAITNRIVNSDTTLAGVAQAEKPEYLINLVEYKDLIENKDYTDADELPGYIEIYPLEVQARSTDGGIISYHWRYVSQYDVEQTDDLGIEGPNNVKALIRTEFRTVEVTEENIEELRASKKLFYQKKLTPEGKETYVAVQLPTDAYEASKNTYYERMAVCVATCVGSYTAVATNRLSSKNKATKNSVTCVIPMPSQPVIQTQIDERAHMGIELKSEDTDAASVRLSVVVTNLEGNGTKQGELIYVWYKRRIDDTTGQETVGDVKNFSYDEDKQPVEVEDASADWIRIEGAEGSTLELTNSQELMDNPKGVEGHYMVVVYNYKNLKAVKVDSAECRVSYRAVKPQIEYPHADSDETKIDFSNDVELKSQIKVEMKDAWLNKWNICDKLTYQWYTTKDDVADVNSDTPIDGATASQFIPTTTGKFYCQVTNHKNDTTAQEVSEIFYVI